MAKYDKWIRNKSDEAFLDAGGKFDVRAANKAIKFTETQLEPTHGILIDKGLPFKLFDYQRDLISRFYGWKTVDGFRRYKTVFFSCARQNFKSFFGQIISLYDLVCNPLRSPNIGWVACSEEEAEPAYNALTWFIKNNKALDEACVITPSYNQITYPANNGRFTLLSSVPKRGWSFTTCVIDEFAYARNDDVYTAVEYSGRARSESTLILISTAGTDRTGEAYNQYNYAKKVQAGEIIDTTYLPLVYEADEGDDIYDPNVWAKANPSLPHGSLNIEEIKAAAEKCRYSKQAETRFKNLSLNIWTQPAETFLNLNMFEACGIKDMPEFKGSDIYVGADFASTSDILALSWWTIQDGLYYLYTHGWVSEKAVNFRAKKNWTRYERFIDEGSLTLCKGDTTNVRDVREFIDKLAKDYKLKSIIFDEKQAKETMLILLDKGYNVLNCPQYYGYYTSPLKKLDELVSNKLLRWDNTKKFLYWQTQNLTIKENNKEQLMPDKATDTEKIDSLSAALMGMIPLIDLTTIAPVKKTCWYDNNTLEYI